MQLEAIEKGQEGKEIWDTEKTKFKTADIIYCYSNNIECDRLSKLIKRQISSGWIEKQFNYMLPIWGKALDSKTQIDWKLIDGKRYIMQTATTGKLK